MKAFIEILFDKRDFGLTDPEIPDQIGVIRVGPDAEKYGDPYEHAAIFVANNGVATVKGLAASNQYNIAHHRAGIKALKLIGLSHYLERIHEKDT